MQTEGRTWLRRNLLLLPIFLVAVVVAAAACGGNADEEPPAPRSPATAAAGVTLRVVGKNIQFDTGRLEVAANSPFQVAFDNQDTGVRHNFAIYQSPDARELVARTELEAGRTIQQLPVDGLPPGTYFYRCDVHPDAMTGDLVVR